MQGVQCRIPIRVRMTGRPTEDDLAGLEDAVARLVGRRLDAATRIVAGDAPPDAPWPAPSAAPRPVPGGYLLPSYADGGAGVQVPAASAPSAAPAPAPTPAAPAENPLVEAMAVFTGIRPSDRASDRYVGRYLGRQITLTTAQYEQLRARVQRETLTAIERASHRVEMALGRYEQQRKVDAEHWLTAPIVKALGRVRDPGPALVEYGRVARTSLAEARTALTAGDLTAAARLLGNGERAAEQAARMVLAYVDQVIGSAELTVTVLEAVRTASAVILFLCAVAATGGAAAAGAGALGLEAGATTTLYGVTASTAGWATAVGAGAAITEEVALAIRRAADGERVDWASIAADAAVQVVVAKFSPGIGQRLANRLSALAVANPAVRAWSARVGMARLVAVATNVLLHQGTQIFATTVRDTVAALRGRPITWAEFGRELVDRLADPTGLLMAAVAPLLGGIQPEPSRATTPPAPAPKPPPSRTDTADWREVNREVGLTKPRTRTGAAVPPPGVQPGTAEQQFQPTPAEWSAAYPAGAQQPGTQPGGPPRTAAGTPIQESAAASPKGATFPAASMGPRGRFGQSIGADLGEAQAYRTALYSGEYGLEAPQGSNVAGRADFVTAARDPSGAMWIIATDVKTLSAGRTPGARSPRGTDPLAQPRRHEPFADPTPGLRPGWDDQVKAAVDRASFPDPRVATEIQAAHRAGRIWVRQLNVDLSPGGQPPTTTPGPLPLPWGALLGPVDRREKDQ